MKKYTTKTLILIGLMAAILSILGPLTVPLPFSPVPISFASLALSYSVILLGRKNSTISCLIYLLLGLIGLPIFSNFSSGPSKLLGPTGGYLIGYLLFVSIAGFILDHFPKKILYSILGFTLGTVALYTLGTLWLSYQMDLSFGEAFSLGVLFYIPGDIIKILLASIHGPIIKNRLLQSGNQ